MRIVWLCPILLIAIACPAEQPKEQDGQGDAPALPARAEACADAPLIAPGTRVFATLRDAAADETLSCAAEPAPDRVYQVEVPEDGVLSVRVDSEAQLALAIFSGEACAPADEVACSADATFDGSVSAPVTPGTWTVVVQGESDESVELKVDLLPGPCVGDGLDGIALDGFFPGNPIAGDANTDAIDQDPQAAGSQGGPLRLCPGDVDGFFLAHLGGSLAINAGDAPFVLRPVTVDVAGTTNPYVPAIRREGQAVDPAEIADDAPPGYYMVRLRTDDTTSSNPLEYSMQITHGCSGDRDDSPLPEFDDGTASYAALAQRARVFTVDRSVTTLSICQGNTDSFLLRPLTTGTAEVGLGNLGSLATSVEFRAFVTEEEPDPQPIPVVAERVFDAAGSRIVVPLTRIDGFYRVNIAAAGEQLETLRYGMQVTFLYDPPANDTCDAASPLVPTTEPTITLGNNAGAASDVVGLCNGDDNAVVGPQPIEDQGTEVFYALEVTEPMNLELAVAASNSTWLGTASIHRLPAGVCPVDLTELVAVRRDGQDLLPDDPPALAACGATRVRAPLPIGDYLVIVEANARTPTTAPRQGPFALTSTVWPDGFPVAAACADPPSFTLPAPGTSTTVLTPAPSPHELRATCGGNGNEAALTFTADTAATVTIRATPPYDTVISVVIGSCDGGGELACNDDRPGHTRFESEVTFEAQPGVPTWVIVDKFALATETPEDAGIEVTVAP